MRTRSLLLLVFGVMFAIVIGRSASSLSSFRGVLVRYNALVDEHDRKSAAVARVAGIAVDLETGVRGWLVTADRRFLEPYERAEESKKAALDDLALIAQSDVDFRRGAEEARAELEGWDREVGAPLRQPGIFERSAAERLAINLDGKARMDRTRVVLDRLRAAIAAQRSEETSSLAAFRQQLVTDTVWLALAMLVILAGLVLVTFRSLERPLAQLVTYSQGVGRSGTAGPPKSGVLEIRALSDALVSMETRLAEERLRERRFTDLVAGLAVGGGVERLAGAALRALVRDRGATAGVLWVARDPEGPLERAAVVGLDPDALLEGGGHLVAEARSSLATAFVDLEGSARVIRSAFVEATPKGLLVAPVVAGTRAVGVIELAGSLAPGGADSDLQRALARIALSLESAIAQERSAELGGKLGQVNEELQGQNEELRAQEEELRTQREELIAKQAELTLKNEALGQASRLKTDFLSTMSHELRTPLNAVIGFSDSLLTGGCGKLTPDQTSSVEDILGAGQRLLSLVNDILDLSKIEAGRFDVELGKVDLGVTTEDACSLLMRAAERKKIRLVNEVARATHYCSADRDRLHQVLANLISNAVKFTPEGGAVTLSASSEEGWVRFRISDTGVGIEEADRERLFRPFSQLESGKPRSVVGTGLGLSISKRLVELMGGEIGFTSKSGEGSVFFFTLPAADPGTLTWDGRGVRAPRFSRVSRVSHLAQEPPDARRAVLVVEDESTDARVTEGLLTREGYSVRIASNAEAALDLLRREKFVLLVVDLGLPGMSGFAFLERVKSDREFTKIPVIVLTARDLAKEELERLEPMAALVAQKGMMTGSGFLESVAAIFPRPRAVRVMVVDDHETNRRVVRSILSSAHYEVVEASDAASGIDLARRDPPALILMDVRMPGMDGLEATRVLGADPRTASVPVVAVSAQAMAGDRDRALAAGCVAYVTKPIARAELLHAVSSAIHAEGSR